MGRRERIERVQEDYERRAAEFLRDRLEPGETLANVIFGLSGWRPGRETILYLLALSDRRVFFVELDQGLPAEVVWAEPFTGVVIEKFKRGRMSMHLYLRRSSDGQEIRFRAPGARATEERVTQAAETLKMASPTRTGAG